jgi:Fur family ferric uptake transcriptional regulator
LGTPLVDDFINQNEAIVSILNTYIEQKKLRKTIERYIVLQEIYQNKEHFEAEGLYQRLKEQNLNISKATIYNTLDLFLECGLIRKHQFGQNISFYEKSIGYKQHDHFICKNCNKVIEFCDPRIQQIKDAASQLLDVTIDSHSLYFYGTCHSAECKKNR